MYIKQYTPKTMLWFSPNYSKHEFPFHRYPQMLHFIKKNTINNWMSIHFIRNYKQDNCPIATNLERVPTVIHVKSWTCEYIVWCTQLYECTHLHPCKNRIHLHTFIHVQILIYVRICIRVNTFIHVHIFMRAETIL